MDPNPYSMQDEAANDLTKLAAVEALLLGETDGYARTAIRIGMVLWDCDRHEAAKRLGIGWRTAYRVKADPPMPALEQLKVSEWLADARNSAREAKAVVAASTALYSYYDANDVLLYVGITDNLQGREHAHVRRSSWMEFAARSTIERFPTREAAEAEERKRIRALKPLFNSAHNIDPDAPRRLVEYLVEHGRTDLLAPAVSRG